MSTVRLPLPDFAVSRSDADELLLENTVRPGDVVVLDGRYLAFNSDSFASQMAHRLIDLGPSIRVIVSGGGDNWIHDIQERLTRGDIDVVEEPVSSSH